MPQQIEPIKGVNEAKEWKIGDYCYLHPETLREKENPYIWKRLPWIVTDFQKATGRIILKTIRNRQTEVSIDHYMEECPEIDFLKFISDFKKADENAIVEYEGKLREARQAHLETLALLQELGIKV